MYKALYRKWRPRDFDDVCGQDSITDILKYEVANNKTSHAYLFCGSRGTGKTSCAKILAKAINCEKPENGNPCNKCEACLSVEAGTATDIIEMDAASNTGVDNVRDIKEEIVFTPSFLKYRVYIIDEVHMMSGGAFNALLKTLEEPPAHAVFILATTELHKLPSTIVSRCQRFDFRRMSTDVIVDRLMYVSEKEGIDLDKSGARAIAKTAQGGMRDALSLLELCAGMKEKIDDALAVRILGVGNRKNVENLVRAISAKEYSTIYKIVSETVLSNAPSKNRFRSA
jgi:DNA polymerase-3 subunit gamma/tau